MAGYSIIGRNKVGAVRGGIEGILYAKEIVVREERKIL